MNDSEANSGFRVDQIDHVELFVPNRQEAAKWYHSVLGLKIVREYANWAEDRRGPLMISSDAGSTKLALFEGKPQGSIETAGFHLVAFRVGATAFMRFVNSLADLDLVNHLGERVTSKSVVDHTAAFSIYFSDPYGHRLELTTYEYEQAKKELAR